MRNADFSASFSETGIERGAYNVELSTYAGRHVFKRCFIFGGQASIFPGMFAREMGELESFRARFARADACMAALGLAPASRFITAPDLLSREEQDQARNPALFVSQVALFDHLLEVGLKPSLITAHSFGEYAGLVAAGIAEFEDVLKIVIERDRLSPDAHAEGLMIVASAGVEQVKATLKANEYYVSCLNSPKQTVISVRAPEADATVKRLMKSGIAAFKLLQVPQPYHTPWLRPCAERLREFIAAANFKFRPARFALLSSVDRGVVEPGAEAPDVAARLAKQMTEPVDFIGQIHLVESRDICHFMELGPNQACTQFVRDIVTHPILKISNVERYLREEVTESKKTFLQADKGKFSSILNGIISSITGYDIDEISLEDKFQEDLGIDSIKKAEIVFKLTEAVTGSRDTFVAESLNLSKITQIGDVLEILTNAQLAKKEAAPKITDFATFREEWRPAEIVPLELLAANATTTHFLDLEKPSTWELETLRREHAVAFCARRLDPAFPSAFKDDPLAHFRQTIPPLLAKWRELGSGSGFATMKFALVIEDGCDPIYECLDGLFMSWVKEFSFAELKVLHFDTLPKTDELRTILEREWLEHTEYLIRFSKGERQVRRWTPLPEAQTRAWVDPVLVSIGGMSGVGSAVSTTAMERYPNGKFYVVGRRAEADPVVQASLAKFRERAAIVNYLVFDASDAVSLSAALTKVHDRHGHIDIVLNGAGAQISRSLSGKTDQEVALEFDSKVLPALNLLKASSKLGVGRLVHYSSVAAKFGNLGQTAYAFANRAMERLSASWRAELPRTTVTTLILPAWDNLGMTEDKVILSRLRAVHASLMPGPVGGKLVLDATELAEPPAALCFMDQNDLHSFEVGLYGRRVANSFVSQPFVRPSRMTVTSLNTSIFPQYLEHNVLGRVVYPASSAVGLFYGVARQILREMPEFRDFKAHSFLPLDVAPSKHHLDLRVKENALELELSSELLHFDVEARRRETRPRFTPTEFKKIRRVDGLRSLQTGIIELGPRFRLLDETWWCEGDDFVGIQKVGRLAHDGPHPSVTYVQQLVESALQVLGSKLLFHHKKYWVPNRIGRMIFNLDNELGEKIYHRVRVDRVVEDRGFGACWVLNERGEVLMEMTDVENFALGESERGVVFVDEA